ncbi:MAG: hypothetical protein AB7E05_07985 [Sphingobium sp.]
MPLAAILCATAPSSDRPDLLRGQIIFAAQTLIEYQARQATGAGARELFIMVEAVTPQLSRLVDRLIADGIQVHLIRDMPALVRQLPRNSDILLFADGMVVDQAYIRQLGAAEGNALLVAEDSGATSHLERVDTLHRWAGVARLSPETVFDTLDLIGDWDLVLTLLRAAVQAGPRRILVSQADIAEGRVALVERQEAADLVAKALIAPVNADGEAAGAERYVLGPLAKLVAPRLLRLQIPPRHLVLGAGGVALLGLALLAPGWKMLALLLFLLALTTNLVADQIAAMGRMTGHGGLVRLAPDMLVLAGVAWIGMQAGMPADGLHLALLSAIAVVVLYRRERPILPPWAYMTPGSAVLLLLAGMLCGLLPAAFALGAVLAIASLAALILVGGRTEPSR